MMICLNIVSINQSKRPKAPSRPSSSSAGGGGGTSFFLGSYLAAFFGSYLAASFLPASALPPAAGAGAEPEAPMSLVPSAINW